MNLIIHHMLQPLIICGADKNLGREGHTGVPIVQHLVTVFLISVKMKSLRKLVRHLGLRRERSSISLFSQQRGDLPQQTLNQLPNGHTRGNSVRIDNQIGSNTLACEGHVFWTIGNTHCSLLTVTTGKLVSNLRDTNRTYTNLHQSETFLVGRQHHTIDNSTLTCTQLNTSISLICLWGTITHILLRSLHLRGLPNDNITPRNSRSWGNQSIFFQLLVTTMPKTRAIIRVRLLEKLFHLYPPLLLRCSIRTIENRAEESTINRGLIHHNRIFLVIPRVTHNRNHTVLTGGEATEVEVLHVFRCHKGFLWVVQNVGQGIHSELVVGDVNSHRLFTHSRLICVTRRLVVIGEGNDRGTDSQNHRRVNFTMGVCERIRILRLASSGFEIANSHRNHDGFLFICVNKFHQTRFDQVLPHPFILLAL
mmetsp:Transcript_10118/g.15281  ORF Transcript_10118/g.15281 Transcript_10118/m.15281 type:complete len:422 (-) Transcript_10118:326-1591(-)